MSVLSSPGSGSLSLQLATTKMPFSTIKELRVVLQIAQKVHERFLMLKLDEKQRDQLCAYTDTLREKLNDAAESAIETGDTLTVQILSKVG